MVFRRKSILFVNPDYHCSFLLRDEFRKMGWRADVYVPLNYPAKLLYRKTGLNSIGMMRIRNPLIRKVVSHLWRSVCLCFALFRYRYFLFYGTMDVWPSRWDRTLEVSFGRSFRAYLSIGKAFRKKMLYLASGCRGEELKSNFSQLDNGSVCGNCGVSECRDELQIPSFNVHRRYADFVFGNGYYKPTCFSVTNIRYKSLDLNLWHPEISIPKRFLLPPTRNLRILHGFYEGGRTSDGKNIKGSRFVLEAIEKLRNEGCAVEYYYLQDVYSKDMRYYQAQADVVVDQLIYGWWGSMGIEAMGLGKPVVCYLRKEWKDFFYTVFPEYDALPIVEADTHTIYDVLKRLVTDDAFRASKGREARVFAEHHFDVRKNVRTLEEVLKEL